MSNAVVYIGIGNSDDKLTQLRWAAFQLDVKRILRDHRAVIIGEWHSAPDSSFQNACFAIDGDHPELPEIQGELTALAKIYDQDAIAWAIAPDTIMLGSSGGRSGLTALRSS